MMRLSKYLQKCGVASRNQADEMIAAGRVKVNGTVTLEAFNRVSDNDQVMVDEKVIQPETEKVYFLLNKPAGYSCFDVPDEDKVTDLFSDLPFRLFTVGSMDKETEGLILVTNDGDLAQEMLKPNSMIEKEYITEVDHPLTEEHLAIIRDGKLVDGVFIKPVKVTKIGKNVLNIVILEGKKREVRYLLYNAGLESLSMKRVRIGPFLLEADLPSGHYKPFDPKILRSPS